MATHVEQFPWLKVWTPIPSVTTYCTEVIVDFLDRNFELEAKNCDSHITLPCELVCLFIRQLVHF